MNSGVPILPEQVAEIRAKQIPLVNELIAKGYVNGRSTVYQDDVTSLITERLGVDKSVVYKEHWLGVEEIFRATGKWKVEYDKPAYCESYRAYFIFTRIN